MIFLDTCILIDYSKDKIILTEEDRNSGNRKLFTTVYYDLIQKESEFKFDTNNNYNNTNNNTQGVHDDE